MTGVAMTIVHPSMHANPMTNGAAAGSNPDASAAAISSNDFLTLLVTEMKNQDPTAQTDPNAYVNQLVQVNSLEQLIEINENLSAAPGESGSSDTPSSYATRSSGARTTGGLIRLPDDSGGSKQKGSGGSSHSIAISRRPIAAIAGNLGIAATNPAAQRVAHALSGAR